MIKSRKIFLFLLMGLFLTLPQVRADYADEIGARPDEVYAAARQVLLKYGIRRENAEQGALESDWIKTSVRRKDALLGSVFQKEYSRRSRVRIEIQGEAALTRVRLSSKHQYKPSDAGRMTTPWRSMKPQADDLKFEKDLFLQIIRHLEQIRVSAP